MRNRPAISAVLAAAGGVCTFAPLWAEVPGALPPGQTAVVPSPLVTISPDRLFSGTVYGKAVQARAEAATAALQAENRRIEADLATEEKSLTAQRPKLAPADFRVLADAFDAKVEAIRNAQDAKSQDLTRKNDAERKRFFETAIPVLGQLMTDLGAVAMLDKSVVVLSFDRIDITDKAIARIDAVLGDGSAQPAAPPAP